MLIWKVCRFPIFAESLLSSRAMLTRLVKKILSEVGPIVKLWFLSLLFETYGNSGIGSTIFIFCSSIYFSQKLLTAGAGGVI